MGCPPAGVRGLVSLGVLRQFTQIERLSLDRHMMGVPGKLPDIQLRGDQAHAQERLTGVHPDYWLYLTELRGVRDRAKDVVARARTTSSRR